jgi:hypothetical protein
MAVKVTVYGTADMRQIDRARQTLNGLEKEARQNATGFGGAMGRVQSAVSSTGAKIASSLAALGLGSYLKESLHAAAMVETSQEQLKAAVEAVSPYVRQSEEHWKDYNETAKETLKKTSDLSAYSKGQLRDALTQLTTTTGKAGKSLDLLQVTTDLARRKNLDLNQAAVLVGKAYNGNITSLARIGVMLPKHASGLQAIDALQKRVAGSAEAYGNSAAGTEAKFNNSLKALQVTIGTALLPVADKFMTWLTGVINAFQNLPGPVKDTIVGVGAVAAAGLLLAPFLSSIIAVGKAFQIAKLAQLGWNAAQLVFNALANANPIGLLITAIGVLVVAVTYFFTKTKLGQQIWQNVVNAIGAGLKWLGDFFGKVFGAIGNAIGAVFRWVGQNWPLILGIITGPIGLAVVFIVTHFKQVQAFLATVWNAIVSGVRNAIGAVVGFFRNLNETILGLLAGAGKWLLDVGRQIVAGLWQGIQNAWSTVTNGVKNLVDGVVGGVKNILGIHSPSAVFDSIGQNTGAGMANGLKKSTPKVVSAAKKMADETTKALKEATANFVGSFSLGQLVTPDGTVTAQSMLASAGSQVTAMRDFVAHVSSLRRKGLNGATISELLKEGPVQGGAQAAALDSMSGSDLKTFNADTASVNRYAGLAAQMTVNSKATPHVTVTPGAVQVNINGNADKNDVSTAVNDALTQFAKELRSQ